MTRMFVLAVLLAGACKAKQAQPRGLGPYRFGVTTRANIHQGICQPTELSDGRKATWCFSLPPIKVGERVAEVDTYFLGTEPPPLPETATKDEKDARKKALETMPLIELQLKVRGCVEAEAERWMRERYGPADPTSKGAKLYWHNDFLTAIAFLPSEPGRCHIHMLPNSEATEIERLKAK